MAYIYILVISQCTFLYEVDILCGYNVASRSPLHQTDGAKTNMLPCYMGSTHYVWWTIYCESCPARWRQSQMTSVSRLTKSRLQPLLQNQLTPSMVLRSCDVRWVKNRGHVTLPTHPALQRDIELIRVIRERRFVDPRGGVNVHEKW